MRLRNLSYRVKTPLSAVLVILLTALILSSVLLVRAYQDSRDDLISNALDLGTVLSQTLRPAMKRDEVWMAYETIMSPLERDAGWQYAVEQGEQPAIPVEGKPEREIYVLDTRSRVYVASRPREYPMLDELARRGAEHAELVRRIEARDDRRPVVFDDVWPGRYVMVVPILAEDSAPLGTLVLSYSSALLVPRFLNALEQVILGTLLVLVILLPLGWYWGKRLTDPLAHLSACMGRVGTEVPSDIQCDLYDGRDEIGQVSYRFRRMLDELREKEELERSMVASERLAAVGRLTAGIAHEINNPLGGMLNAISTYKRHGDERDPVADRTISLLERGLVQIKGTVGALLVEARLESHALTPDDLQDIRTLVQPDIQRKGLRLVWDNAIDAPVALPSSQVRQVLLNLLLNAVQASDEGGEVLCWLRADNRFFHAAISNGGKHISRGRMAHLFEPFATSSGEGHGLGLWVTYQLIQQLDGQIEVTSNESVTIFEVTLPLSEGESS
ncbi:HAMP domain-containing sensor histidine kinase [Thioalkalivibrio sp. ALMg11]|uniref:sensor histidine kinase n=1 Tax=Thioalkalivibrio sp. ALMg11 TaxID=1158165 RepID=UPI000475C6CC|nr:HAMP domain-containing sensor histidine kinase [Thioalkalivibrio sp. ALMg11]